jgi:hypothetical protein
MTSSTSTAGSPTTSRSDAAAAPPPARPEPAPSAELLEFLGEFSDERGEWLDPLDLEGAGAEDGGRGDGP